MSFSPLNAWPHKRDHKTLLFEVEARTKRKHVFKVRPLSANKFKGSYKGQLKLLKNKATSHAGDRTSLGVVYKISRLFTSAWRFLLK